MPTNTSISAICRGDGLSGANGRRKRALLPSCFLGGGRASSGLTFARVGAGRPMLYLIEQCLNGIQLGMLLFLLAAGLTLVFGIMDLVNLAHGSLYMLGAYFAATFAAWTGSFVAGAILALGATMIVGMAVEVVALRPLYGRDHLDHVLGTFGLILFFNELVRIVWGPAGLRLPLPDWLDTSVPLLPGLDYPAYRLAIIVTALAVALL